MEVALELSGWKSLKMDARMGGWGDTGRPRREQSCTGSPASLETARVAWAARGEEHGCADRRQ